MNNDEINLVGALSPIIDTVVTLFRTAEQIGTDSRLHPSSPYLRISAVFVV